MIRRLFAVALCAVTLAGCAAKGAPAAYRLALVSESYAVALQRLQAWEIGQHRAGYIAEADHVVWQRRIERMAVAGKSVNDAIRASQVSSVQEQARAILAIVDELIAEQVIRFNEQQRLTVTLLLEALKTATLVWSASLQAAHVGPDAVLADVLVEAN